jgi:hypothetical protein
MKPRYEIIENPMGGTTINAHYENGVMLSIPTNPTNSDYQRYLAWLENPDAEQSTPIVIDEAEAK